MLEFQRLIRWAPHPPLTLLASREDETRQTFERFLAESGCDVETADDGRVALARVMSAHFDVFVAEEALPGLGAAQLSRVLRSDPATRELPIVVIHAEPDHVRALETAGVSAVIVDPSPPETLAIEMQRVLTESLRLRAQGSTTRGKARAQIQHSSELIARSMQQRRPTMSHAHLRVRTQAPALAPPALPCPVCDRRLTYEYSHTGGVNPKQNEQWDYFECPSGCGTFQFRHRTNKLRRVS